MTRINSDQLCDGEDSVCHFSGEGLACCQFGREKPRCFWSPGTQCGLYMPATQKPLKGSQGVVFQRDFAKSHFHGPIDG
jgi:hypothetical protein